MRKMDTNRMLRIAIPMLVVLCIWGISVSGEHLYAGYYHTVSRTGIEGEIWTINPAIPNNPSQTDFVCEWVTIIFSKDPLYWVQLGYNKGEDSGNLLQYYREKQDSGGYSLDWIPRAVTFPAASSWHVYRILVGGSANTYNYSIDNTARGSHTLSKGTPTTPQELQAFAETTDKRIKITGTHFKELEEYNGTNWSNWSASTSYSNAPYTVTRVSKSEFSAKSPVPFPTDNPLAVGPEIGDLSREVSLLKLGLKFGFDVLLWPGDNDITLRKVFTYGLTVNPSEGFILGNLILLSYANHEIQSYTKDAITIQIMRGSCAPGDIECGILEKSSFFSADTIQLHAYGAEEECPSIVWFAYKGKYYIISGTYKVEYLTNVAKSMVSILDYLLLPRY